MVADALSSVKQSRTEFDLPLLKRSMLELWIGVKAAWDYPVREGSCHLNVGHVPVYSNGKFDPAGLPRHPRRDITYTAFHCVLMGKVYCRGGGWYVMCAKCYPGGCLLVFESLFFFCRSMTFYTCQLQLFYSVVAVTSLCAHCFDKNLVFLCF